MGVLITLIKVWLALRSVKYYTTFLTVYSHDSTLGIIQNFHKSTESTLGEGVNPGGHLDLATVPVHERSLANQHFCDMLLGRGGVRKKTTLCMHVKMLKIMDGPLLIT